MKKVLNLLFVFSMLLNIIAPLAVYASDEVVLGRVTSGSGLNLRTTPTTASSNNIILTLPLHEYVIVTGKIDNISGCSNYWYTVTYNNQNGVVCSNLIELTTIKPAETDTTFPESYQSQLAILKQLRPNWKFEALHTNIEWSDLVQGQNPLGKNLIQTRHDGWKNILSYNFETGKYDNNYSGGGSSWYAPSDAILSYYLDPRNFLSESSVFTFEKLSFDYDNYTAAEIVTMKAGIQKMLNGTFMENKPVLTAEDRNRNWTYAEIFLESAKINRVSPYFLVSRVLLEVSSKRTTIVSGTVEDYEGYFNFFNIGATGAQGSIIKNGLDKAVAEGWNSEYKAIIGGALFVSKYYINKYPTEPLKNKDTLYTQKFNVVAVPYFSYQYMQNIQAPSTEASITYNGYLNQNLLTENFTFKIPVYLNMPSQVPLPPTDGQLNYLSDLKIDGKSLVGFNRDILEYNLTVGKLKSSINVTASTYDSSVSIKGTGNITLDKDVQIIEIKVGTDDDLRVYKINVVKTESEFITIDDVLDASKISYDNDSLKGLKLSTTTENLKTSLSKHSADLIIIIKDMNGNIKTSGNIGTGDLISITLNSETKEIRAIVPGDLNGDGLVTIVDLLRVQNTLLKRSNLSSALAAGGDVNQDGKVTLVDLLRVQKHILGAELIR